MSSLRLFLIRFTRRDAWKLCPDRDEHLIILAAMIMILGELVPYILSKRTEYTDIVSDASVNISIWLLIWASQRGKLIKVPKRFLHFWIWVNGVMSIMLMLSTVGILGW